MIGIDLVDLKDPLLKTRNNRAHSLIHNPQDQALATSEEFGFWYLWTAKEAVFKVARKKTSFAPTKIPVQISQHGNDIYFQSENDVTGCIYTFSDIIISVAHHTSVKEVEFYYTKSLSSNLSSEARACLVKYFQEHHHMKVQVVNDDEGFPAFNISNTPISFSHHGRYLAFAYPAPE